MPDTKQLRGQLSSTFYVDDWWPPNTTTVSTYVTVSSIPMGRRHPFELSPEEKLRRAKQEKIEQEKAIKRKVLGPKRSRWR
jgi:hypothetical protein